MLWPLIHIKFWTPWVGKIIAYQVFFFIKALDISEIVGDILKLQSLLVQFFTIAQRFLLLKYAGKKTHSEIKII